MKTLQQHQMNRRPCEKAATDKFKREMAHLTSLIEQIKRYDLPFLNRMLEMKLLEDLLSLPELADHDWRQESARVQSMVLDFLNVNISVYSKALEQLKAKNL